MRRRYFYGHIISAEPVKCKILKMNILNKASDSRNPRSTPRPRPAVRDRPIALKLMREGAIDHHPKVGMSLPAIAVIFFIFTFLSACQSRFYYEEQKDIPQGRWNYADTLDFRFSIADTSKTYNLYLDFGYLDTFPTQNLYLKLHTRFPDAKRLSKQISFNLFDAQGVPYGECSGHKCRYLAVLQENAFFNQPGEYVITAEQYTRRDSLPGILSVGLAIEPAGGREK